MLTICVIFGTQNRLYQFDRAKWLCTKFQTVSKHSIYLVLKISHNYELGSSCFYAFGSLNHSKTICCRHTAKSHHTTKVKFLIISVNHLCFLDLWSDFKCNSFVKPICMCLKHWIVEIAWQTSKTSHYLRLSFFHWIMAHRVLCWHVHQIHVAICAVVNDIRFVCDWWLISVAFLKT